MFEEDMVDQKKEEEEALMVGRVFLFITLKFREERVDLLCANISVMYARFGF